MNCVQFERVLPDYLEGVRTPEQEAHCDSCLRCSSLVADLKLIVSEAPSLGALEEPSVRVWNELRTRLRQEGLIHAPAPSRIPALPFFSRWRTGWLLPVSAALVIAAGIKLYWPARVGDNLAAPRPAISRAPAPASVSVSAEDKDLLKAVSTRPPGQVAAYKAGLDAANAFIRDAEASVKDNPNDVYSQQLLIDAYGQKEMVYSLAVDQTAGEQ